VISELGTFGDSHFTAGWTEKERFLTLQPSTAIENQTFGAGVTNDIYFFIKKYYF